MKPEEAILLYIAAIVAGLFILMFVMRWIFKIDKLIRYQEGIIAALFEIAKKQGVPQDRIEGIINTIKH
jgi:hypothetical protein